MDKNTAAAADTAQPAPYVTTAPELPVLILRDKLSGGRVHLWITGGIVTGAMGTEPARYMGKTEARARHVARYGGR